ncbi:MAG: acyl-CoA thioesterase [Pikeienuella sp.]|uniref:acyl-CoA thioesterase n=1 Tax=Pikeienuella sp. TaxID=2831957 RepID=UPI00391A754D
MTPDLTDRSAFRFFEHVSLRYSDQDSMGHVNNVAYAALIEAGRIGLFTEILKNEQDQSLNFVLAHVAIDYRKEMHFPGVVEVGGRMLRVGRSSITTGYGCFLNGVCHATATCVNVYFDPETRLSRPFPDWLRSVFERSIRD